MCISYTQLCEVDEPETIDFLSHVAKSANISKRNLKSNYWGMLKLLDYQLHFNSEDYDKKLRQVNKFLSKKNTAEQPKAEETSSPISSDNRSVKKVVLKKRDSSTGKPSL